jgi:hypothetical protein
MALLWTLLKRCGCTSWRQRKGLLMHFSISARKAGVLGVRDYAGVLLPTRWKRVAGTSALRQRVTLQLELL